MACSYIFTECISFSWSRYDSCWQRAVGHLGVHRISDRVLSPYSIWNFIALDDDEKIEIMFLKLYKIKRNSSPNRKVSVAWQQNVMLMFFGSEFYRFKFDLLFSRFLIKKWDTWTGRVLRTTDVLLGENSWFWSPFSRHGRIVS